jgi:hypothetical protein
MLRLLVCSLALAAVTACQQNGASTYESAPAPMDTPSTQGEAPAAAAPQTGSGLPTAEEMAVAMAPDPAAVDTQTPPVEMDPELLEQGSVPSQPVDGDPLVSQIQLATTLSGISPGMTLEQVGQVFGMPESIPPALSGAMTEVEFAAQAADVVFEAGADGVWTVDSLTARAPTLLVNGNGVGIGTPRSHVELIYKIDGFAYTDDGMAVTVEHEGVQARFVFDEQGNVSELGAARL